MTSRRLDVKDIPDLPGFSTVAQIAAKWSVHKGTVFYMILHQLAFPEGSVYKVSKGKEDQRPLILVKTDVANEIMGRRAETLKKISPTYSGDVGAWNRRVKEWGKSVGWTETAIRTMGPPTQLLEDAYVQQFPDDPRPEGPEESENDRAYNEALAAWSSRVKTWGQTTGWTTTLIRATGLPNVPLVRAYLKEHPDDVRPTRTEIARQSVRIEHGADSAESH
jgi:hypothetical protein